MAGAFRAGCEDAIGRVGAQLEIQVCYCPQLTAVLRPVMTGLWLSIFDASRGKARSR